MNLDRFEQAYQHYHNNHPPYSFVKSTFGCSFYYDDSFIFTILFCSQETGERITAGLNAAFLEGWMIREREAQQEGVK